MQELNAHMLNAHADGYRLLAIFLAFPTDVAARGTADGSVFSDMQAILREGSFSGEDAEAVLRAFEPEAVCNADEGDLLKALRRDFTHLFTNPENPVAMPYEAVFKGADDYDYSSLTFISPTSQDALRLYAKLGLGMNADVHDSPDHIAAECDFASFALHEWALALDEGNEGRAAEVSEVYGEFMRNHLDKWQEDFFSTVAHHAQTPVYRSLGKLGVALAQAHLAASKPE